MDRQYSKILMGAEKIRNRSNYNDFYIASKEEAVIQIENAEKFINAMENYINEHLT